MVGSAVLFTSSLLEGPCVFVSSTTNLSLLSLGDRASAYNGREHLEARGLHSVFVLDIVWRRVVFAGNCCHGTSHQLFPPRRAIPGSCLRSPSTGSLPYVSSYETRTHSTNATAPFPRPHEPCHCSLHRVVLYDAEVQQEISPTVRSTGA